MGQKEQKHQRIGSYLKARNTFTVKRLLSLKEKAEGNSAKTLRVLFKHPDLAEFSARVTR